MRHQALKINIEVLVGYVEYVGLAGQQGTCDEYRVHEACRNVRNKRDLTVGPRCIE